MTGLRVATAALLLGGCFACGAADTDADSLEPLKEFPRRTLEIASGGTSHNFDVWVADHPSLRSTGLMFGEKHQQGHCMLCPYGEPQTISMWMKNTLIPLDMLFVAADGRITRIARRTRPKSLATISSLGFVTAVIEIGGGE